MAVVDKTFEGKTFVIDNREFVRCQFTRCKLIYRGAKPPSFQGCNFWGTQFSFEGPAGNTLAFLQSLSDPGSGLQPIVLEMLPALRG